MARTGEWRGGRIAPVMLVALVGGLALIGVLVLQLQQLQTTTTTAPSTGL